MSNRYNRSKTISRHQIEANQPDLFLVDITTPAGTSYFFNGLGLFDWNGNTYLGTGQLGSIEIEGNGSEIAETQVKFTLSGVDEGVTDLLDSTVKPGTAIVRQAFLRSDWTVDVIKTIEECLLEKMELSVGDGTASITLVAKGGFHEINSRSSAHWDPENQRQKLIAAGIDPDGAGKDTGFDLMSEMRDKLIVSQAE